MTGSEGFGPRAPRLCAACAAQEQIEERKWTQETVIEAIQLFARENGRPPLSSEWLVRQDRRFPPTSAIYRYKPKGRGGKRNRSGRHNPFASWADAIEAAGFPRPKIGHKVMPQGQGRSQMARRYFVLHKNRAGNWNLKETDAFSPETAIEKIASAPGRYVAVLDRYWTEYEVASVRKLAVLSTNENPEP
jgi:hypothetical protein